MFCPDGGENDAFLPFETTSGPNDADVPRKVASAVRRKRREVQSVTFQVPRFTTELFARSIRALGSRRSVGLLILGLLMVFRAWDPLVLQEVKLRTFDFYQNIKPRIATERPVTIVDIDEDSIRAFGQWPWPRTLVADLLTRLYEMQSVAMGFDIVFPEPDRAS